MIQFSAPALDLGLFRANRLRLIRQTEAAECGLAALAMIANHYGMDVDLSALRRGFKPSLRGLTLKSLMSTADAVGLAGRAVRLPLGKLGDLHLPAILHWDMNHFVVVEKVTRQKALIHDPAGSSRWMALSDVSEHFTGVALELRPTDDFIPIRDRERLKLSQLWRTITGLKRALIQTAILSIVLEAFVLASPFYMQIAIDNALPALDLSLLKVLAIGFGLFALINAAAGLLRSFVLLSAGTSVAYGVGVNIARRLFRLPVSWFQARHVGDVLSRFQSVKPIQQLLTQGALTAVIDGMLAVFTLVLMIVYSPTLTVVTLAAFAAYAGVRIMSFAAQRSSQEDAIATAGKEQSVMIESLRGIVTLRLFNRESARHALWQSKLTDSTNATVALTRIGIWQNSASILIFGVETIASVWLAVGFVMAGGFSLGMVFAFMAYKTQYVQRASSLIDQGIAFRMLGLHLERLSDIALAQEDVSFSTQSIPPRQLAGAVELRDVSFRYSPSDPLVLNRVNLRVASGEHIAITGPSGGGKTTLLKILLGLLEPDEGQVIVDGIPLREFGYKNYLEQVGAVLQDDNLFAGSFSQNIALFDDEPDSQRVADSARKAALHEEIESMPMGYQTPVGDMGSTLSGGQRQRLLLARALYRNPKILCMDEGTSHLDAEREKAVNLEISSLGATRIMVAHRIETVLNASRVLILDGTLREVSADIDHVRQQVDRTRSFLNLP